MADKILVKRRNGQYDWLTKTKADELIKKGRAKQADPRTFKVIDEQPEEKPAKKKGKKS